jgi:hypothetical protein
MPETFRVKCSGKLHSIRMSGNEFEFLDHNPEELDTELAFAKLGGQPCRCAMILSDFRNGIFKARLGIVVREPWQ